MNDPTHIDELTLTEYLDDVLAPDEQAEVERHLAGCPACAAQAAAFRALFTALEGLPPLRLERDLAPAVLAAILPAPSPVSRVRGLGWVLGVQLVLVTVLAVFLWQWLLPVLIEVQLATHAAWRSLDFTALLVQAQWMWDRAFAPLQALELPAFRDVTGIALPWSTAAGVFLAAAVLWLAGNRLLLMPTRTTPPS